jgi:hypothetical protein
MLTKAFWLAALERALKTAAQAALLVLGADQVDAMAASWGDVFGFAVGGLVLSLLTSVASSHIGPEPGPSVTNEVLEGPRPMGRRP